jgi:hypothetical protein
MTVEVAALIGGALVLAYAVGVGLKSLRGRRGGPL